MKSIKIRLDHLLTEHGLVENQNRAKARIMAGDVLVDEIPIDKPGTKFKRGVTVRMRNNSHPFVSRGGIKLKAVIDEWPAPIAGAVCMDVGASTGGFTEVLLLNGAKKVYAVDVGHNQLDFKIRSDKRVLNMERCHILKLAKEDLEELPTVASVDVSFISLARVLPHLKSLLAPDSFTYALIKPQFEAGAEHVEKGGIVKNPKIHEQCIEKIAVLAQDLGFFVRGIKKSPITGTKGNIEFLIALQKVSGCA